MQACFSNFADCLHSIFLLVCFPRREQADIGLHLRLQPANPMNGKNSLEGTLPTLRQRAPTDSLKVVVLTFAREIESIVGIENIHKDCRAGNAISCQNFFPSFLLSAPKLSPYKVF